MKVKGDKVTTMFGLIGSLLVVQQSYFPDLLPREVVAPLVASLVGGYGISTGKDEMEVPFTENTQKKKKLCELEAEIQQLKEELEMSRGLHLEGEDPNNVK